MGLSQYTQGDLIDFPLTFTDETGAPIDPSTVAWVFSCGALGPVTLTYTGASTPASDSVWRTGAGLYVARVDTTPIPVTRPTLLRGSAVSTGTGQAVGVLAVILLPNPAYQTPGC